MSDGASDEYVQLMTRNQSRLYAFILSLVGHPVMADDILQETNIVLWRKAGSFEEGTNFNAWMYRIAHFQVLAQLKKTRSDVLIFDTSRMPELASQVEEQLDDYDARQQALRACLDKLGPRQREMVRMRYQTETTLEQISAALGETVAAIKQVLFRSRAALESCIRRSLAESGTPHE